MKNRYMLLFLILLTGCSSSYSPSEKMLAYKKNMSSDQAVEVLQKAIWDNSEPEGICGTRGFWHDDASNMKVQADKISMLSHKRGKQLKKVDKGFSGVVVFEKQYYKYNFEFNKISSIDIYDDPRVLPYFPVCNIKDLKDKYFIIDLYSDEKSSLKFIVLDKNFDQTMAALSTLLSDKPVILK